MQRAQRGYIFEKGAGGKRECGGEEHDGLGLQRPSATEQYNQPNECVCDGLKPNTAANNAAGALYQHI
ncbi:unnamed protein product [Danaus chrysippus]|uniref:(African queen) hypothetical protein n=1 Tax=Danaus chrysippus TaxID=151541 RepID=A0A8J2W8J1_9NEOP|nr:unnamed protein product [Danaus chrysippus]